MSEIGPEVEAKLIIKITNNRTDVMRTEMNIEKMCREIDLLSFNMISFFMGS
jgi:hypothetical protein